MSVSSPISWTFPLVCCLRVYRPHAGLARAAGAASHALAARRVCVWHVRHAMSEDFSRPDNRAWLTAGRTYDDRSSERTSCGPLTVLFARPVYCSAAHGGTRRCKSNAAARSGGEECCYLLRRLRAARSSTAGTSRRAERTHLSTPPEGRATVRATLAGHMAQRVSRQACRAASRRQPRDAGASPQAAPRSETPELPRPAPEPGVSIYLDDVRLWTLTAN